MIALCTLWFIEANGYAADVQQHYFGGANSMGQYTQLVSHNYYDGIKAVMFILFAFFVMYIFFFVMFFVAVAVVYFVITSRWRKPRVFISYKKAAADSTIRTDEIALDIKANLESKGFRILFFQYTLSLDHDSVNSGIQKLLRKAHAMIVIPDPYQPSYVNAEIQCAAYSFKPLCIIKHTIDQRLPDTANSGHPVLILEKLKEEKYKPLSYILQYVHRVWHKRLFIVWMPLISFLFPFVYLEDEDGNYLKALLVFALLTAGLVYFNVPVAIVLLIVKIITAAIGVYVAYITLSEVIKNIQLQKVIKQSMINAGNTYDYFVAADFDKSILACVDQVGLVK